MKRLEPEDTSSRKSIDPLEIVKKSLEAYKSLKSRHGKPVPNKEWTVLATICRVDGDGLVDVVSMATYVFTSSMRVQYIYTSTSINTVEQRRLVRANFVRMDVYFEIHMRRFLRDVPFVVIFSIASRFCIKTKGRKMKYFKDLIPRA